MNNQRILTVGELSSRIRALLETHFSFVCVVGEISNFRRPSSGHWYFTLKDRQAALKAVLFRMQQRYVRKMPVDGMEVICRGRISLYEPRGDYQIIVDTIEPRGAGELQLALEQLKAKLAAEGIFAESLKKKPPLLPQHITVVTSPQGAAIHDFIRIARSRSRAVTIAVYPVAVQGPGSADEIAAAIGRINREVSTDIIVLCRGGGSLEDLWSFNEEQTIRAIHASKIPVVSAIGHEIDHTLADLAADLRAPTPSGAAEMLIPEGEALRMRILQLRERLASLLRLRLQAHGERIGMHKRMLGRMQQPLSHFFLRLDYAVTALENALNTRIGSGTRRLETLETRLRAANPLSQLRQEEQELANLRHRIIQAMTTELEKRRTRFHHAAQLLDAVSPLSILSRGYAVVMGPLPQKKVIRDESQLRPGDRIEVLLQRGRLHCLVQGDQPEES